MTDFTEERAQLQQLRELEATIAGLRDQLNELEVEAIVANTSSAVELPDGLTLSDEQACRLVELAEREEKLQRSLGRAGAVASTDALSACQDAMGVLRDWLAASEKPPETTFQKVVPLLFLIAVAAVSWAAWQYHWVLLVVLLPIAGAASFVTNTGYDVDFKRAGAQRRYDAIGRPPPTAWEEAPVRERLAALERESEALTARAEAAANRPELDEAATEALAQELEAVELERFSSCAQVGLDPEALTPELIEKLREYGALVLRRRALGKAKRDLRARQREADEIGEQLFKWLSAEGVSPEGGKANAVTLAAALEKLSDRSDA